VSGLTPGEMAALNSRKAAMVKGEFDPLFWNSGERTTDNAPEYARMARNCALCGAEYGGSEWHSDDCPNTPLGYDGLDDDSTTYGGKDGF
jgi:hypothetical protein